MIITIIIKYTRSAKAILSTSQSQALNMWNGQTALTATTSMAYMQQCRLWSTRKRVDGQALQATLKEMGRNSFKN